MAKLRQTIEIPGMPHGAPIPNGSKIGNMVFSSGISGRDIEKKLTPEDPDEQAAAMFRNLKTFMEKAGGTPDHIVHMTVFMKDEKYRDHVNKEWIKMFPNEDDRPARHAIKIDLRGNNYFQIEVVAVL